MKILIVDDEADTRALLKDLLTQAGHEPICASGAAVALAQLKVDTPDLILLDIMMPGIDGHQLGQHLATHWNTFDIPVLVVSARGDPESKAWAKLNNCVGYIEKPFAPAELLDKIDEVMRRNASPAP